MGNFIRTFRVVILGCAMGVLTLEFACAQPPPESVGAWKLEELRTKDGKTFKGLVQDEREHDLDFAEIVQPVGKPMFAVLRWVRKREVLGITKLPETEHAELRKRFEQFRHRTEIEAGKMDELLIKSDEIGGQKHQLYDGPWFRVDSTTDEETTRRCVVRIEQIFRAYRMILPPKGRPQETLRVRLYGSLDEYRAELRRLKLNITNPAFYSTRERTILAGSDLDTYSRHLAEIRLDHEQARKDWEQRDSDFQKLIRDESLKLKNAGFTAAEIDDEIKIRGARFRTQLAAKFKQFEEINFRNDSKFAEVTAQMFAQLYHEAFHAWIDNFVYAKSRKNVPRWLNEGLAQIFESGELDAQEFLRLDAPSPAKLKLLQDDLRRNPWPLAEMLNVENPPFLDGHTSDSQAADRTYAYAWGLAWYLAIHQQKLAGPALDQLVSPGSAELSPIARFEKFTGKKLPHFEQEWRRAILDVRLPR